MVEEDEFRATYRSLNTQRCVFEKVLNARRATCSRMHRFHLADREGVRCRSAAALARCTDFLEHLRTNARFALGLAHVGGPLPHNREIRVQAGGLLALQALLHPEARDAEVAEDIHGLLEEATGRYGDSAAFPYSALMPGIAAFRPRARRPRD
ncbi:MAG: hypothetical protein D6721_06255 [Gammaproteobacteria bacterium]|nr:MAG: hypothetical protein D6721_06255 [Gammaproteobacteria bacterium]